MQANTEPGLTKTLLDFANKNGAGDVVKKFLDACETVDDATVVMAAVFLHEYVSYNTRSLDDNHTKLKKSVSARRALQAYLPNHIAPKVLATILTKGKTHLMRNIGVIFLDKIPGARLIAYKSFRNNKDGITLLDLAINEKYAPAKFILWALEFRLPATYGTLLKAGVFMHKHLSSNTQSLNDNQAKFKRAVSMRRMIQDGFPDCIAPMVLASILNYESDDLMRCINVIFLKEITQSRLDAYKSFENSKGKTLLDISFENFYLKESTHTSFFYYLIKNNFTSKNACIDIYFKANIRARLLYNELTSILNKAKGKRKITHDKIICLAEDYKGANPHSTIHWTLALCASQLNEDKSREMFYQLLTCWKGKPTYQAILAASFGQKAEIKSKNIMKNVGTTILNDPSQEPEGNRKKRQKLEKNPNYYHILKTTNFLLLGLGIFPPKTTRQEIGGTYKKNKAIDLLCNLSFSNNIFNFLYHPGTREFATSNKIIAIINQQSMFNKPGYEFNEDGTKELKGAFVPKK